MLLGDPRDNSISEAVIGCAIEVHRALGHARRTFERQLSVPLYNRGVLLSEHRLDLVVDQRIVVEVKNVVRFEPVHTAQLMTYLRVLNLRLGLLINFNVAVLRNGIKRVML